MTGVLRKLGWLLLGSVLILQTGCALALVGAAAGAGAAGYMYYNGLLYRDYHANLGDTVAAVRTSLVELQFPLIKEKNDTGSSYFQTQTGDGHTVRVYLDTVPSSIPAEGAITRVSIRVGFAGDDVVSARILDQVSKHLIPPGTIPPAGSGAIAPGATSGVIKPIPAPGTPTGPITPASATQGVTTPVVPSPRAPTETAAPPLAPLSALPAKPTPIAATGKR